MTTVVQYNNIAQLGKWILSFLGALIGIVAVSVFYGTSFMKDTANAITNTNNTISTFKSDFSDFKKDTKSDIKDLKDGQDNLSDKVNYLMIKNGIHYSTATADKNRNYTLHSVR